MLARSDFSAASARGDLVVAAGLDAASNIASPTASNLFILVMIFFRFFGGVQI
jgi:hypothetical protein